MLEQQFGSHPVNGQRSNGLTESFIYRLGSACSSLDRFPAPARRSLDSLWTWGRGRKGLRAGNRTSNGSRDAFFLHFFIFILFFLNLCHLSFSKMWLVLTFGRIFSAWDHQTFPPHKKNSSSSPQITVAAVVHRRPAGNCFLWGGYTVYLKPVFYFRSEKTSFTSVFLRWQTTCTNHPGLARSCITLVRDQ